jgi:fumarate hydratase class II
MKHMNTRIEQDTFGPIEVPAQRLWGAQTQRSLQNFNISGERQPHELIRALVQVKRSSAVVNHLMGLMDRKASAIIAAGRRGLAGKHDANSAGVLADRIGHADQHERERGAGQSRQ